MARGFRGRGRIQAGRSRSRSRSRSRFRSRSRSWDSQARPVQAHPCAKGLPARHPVCQVRPPGWPLGWARLMDFRRSPRAIHRPPSKPSRPGSPVETPRVEPTRPARPDSGSGFRPHRHPKSTRQKRWRARPPDWIEPRAPCQYVDAAHGASQEGPTPARSIPNRSDRPRSPPVYVWFMGHRPPC